MCNSVGDPTAARPRHARVGGPDDQRGVSAGLTAGAAPPGELDKLIAKNNEGRKVQPAPGVDDLGYLRRLSVDLIGRIPTEAEIKQYLAWPAAERRA